MAAHTSSSLANIAPEIRRRILQHLFRDNILIADLDQADRHEETQGVVRLKRDGQNIRSQCELEFKVPSVLLVSKQLYDEGFELFYQISELHLKELDWTCTWHDSWTADYVRQALPGVWLTKVQMVRFSIGNRSEVREIMSMMPSLKKVVLPTVCIKVDIESWSAEKDKELAVLAIDHPKLGKTKDVAAHFASCCIECGLYIEPPRNGNRDMPGATRQTMTVVVDFSTGGVLKRTLKQETYHAGRDGGWYKFQGLLICERQ